LEAAGHHIPKDSNFKHLNMHFLIHNPCIIRIYAIIVSINAHKCIEITVVYIHSELLHVLANHVAIFREVKLKNVILFSTS
jgi:metal-responsive CopG/Arc/MetJ family transcriptional regulator